MKEILAYTDGSAVVTGKNKGNGGFGTYFPDLNGQHVGYRCGYKSTKTGRMELTALYHAIVAIDKTTICKLKVYSDSEYVVKSFTEGRLKRWIKAGWKTAASQEVKNKDIWLEIVHAISKRPKMVFDIKHIRSHQVDKEKDKSKKMDLMKDPHIIGNMMADRLADYKSHDVLLDCDKIQN